MALPQKKRRFRKIVVGGTEFNWRFNAIIEIRPVSSKDNKLEVDFGWFDVWLYVDGRTPEPPAYDPKVVTPSFVKEAIEFALANNWDINQKVLVTKIKFCNKEFIVV